MTTATIDAANGGERVNGGNVGQPRWEIIVSANGDTLWVNGNDGLCWACFSKRFGMNVHRNASMESAASECLRCTHRSAGIDEWAIFRAEVLRYQGVVMGIRIPWLISVYAPHQLVIELMPHPEGRDRPISADRSSVTNVPSVHRIRQSIEVMQAFAQWTELVLSGSRWTPVTRLLL